MAPPGGDGHDFDAGFADRLQRWWSGSASVIRTSISDNDAIVARQTRSELALVGQRHLARGGLDRGALDARVVEVVLGQALLGVDPADAQEQDIAIELGEGTLGQVADQAELPGPDDSARSGSRACWGRRPAPRRR